MLPRLTQVMATLSLPPACQQSTKSWATLDAWITATLPSPQGPLEMLELLHVTCRDVS